MLKTIFRLGVYCAIAYFLKDFLNEIVPLPTEGMVKGFLDIEKPKDAATLQSLRFVVWVVLIALLNKYAKPLFSFMLPYAHRLSGTKPFRRFQGVLAEFILFFGVFYISGLLIAIYPAYRTYKDTLEREWQDDIDLYHEWKHFSDSAIVQNRIDAGKFVEANSQKFLVFSSIWPRDMLRDADAYSLQAFIDHPENNKPLVDGQLGWYKPDIRYTKEYQDYFKRQQDYLSGRKSLDSLYDVVMHNDVAHEKWDKDKRKEVWKKLGSPVKLWLDEFKSIKWIAYIIAAAVTLVQFFSNKKTLGKAYEKFMRFLEQTKFGVGGSSRFAGLIEEWATLYPNQKNSLYMGRSLYNPFLNVGLEDDRHMLTIAGSRAGKGTSVIIPNLLLWEGSALVIDPKGTNAAVTARRRKEMGQNVHLIDPFGILGEADTACFNPLDTVDVNSPHVREQINIIAEALVVPDPNQKERHWDDGAKTIIAGLIGHMMSMGTIKNPTLSMIRDLLSAMPEDQLGLWAAMSLNEGAGRLPKDAAFRIIRGMKNSEISSIMSSADKHTEWLSSPAMQKTLGSSSFKFSDLKEKPTTIYLIIPPQYLETHNRFLRLFINLVISQMAVGGRSKVPVLLLMDEFLALGRMDEVEKAFGLMAGYNLVLWPFVQDLGRLKKLYGTSVNSFIANCRAIQVFGVADEETKEFVSKYIGERRLSSGLKLGGLNDLVKLRNPTEVSKDIAADTDRQYILRSGKAPLLLEKVKYYKSAPMKLLEPLTFIGSKRFGIFEGMYDTDPDFK